MAVWSAPASAPCIARRKYSAAAAATGASTPVSSASRRKASTSFRMSAIAKPASKRPVRMNWGNFHSLAFERPLDAERISTARAGSIPARRATTTASAVATRHAADVTLLTSFMAWPVPGPPTWKIFFPRRARIGRARSRSAASPPTMIDSVASTAPRTPPETGASSIAAPRACTSLASRRVLDGSAVVISSIRWPGPSFGRSAA